MKPKKTHSTFVKQSRDIHGDKYEYLEEYKGVFEKITIVCKIHGPFVQTPNHHIHGKNGCPQCSRLKQGPVVKSNTQFLEECRDVHGDKYEYPEEYKGCSIKISIKCPEHGLFKKTPPSHIYHKNGCPKCSMNGTSKSAKTWLDSLAIPHLQTFESPEGEFKIPGTRWKVDGYDRETNTVYEYHGTYWHGHPSHPEYVENEKHPRVKMTWKELYDKTIERDAAIIDLGYNLVVHWQRR